MKEFDLEKAKSGAPVCTRDGRPARIICWDFTEVELMREYKIIALIDYGDYEKIEMYNCAGESRTRHEKGKNNLMMAPVKREGWINICKDEYGVPVTIERIWKSEESARNAANGDESYIATAKIEWEE